MVLLAKINHDQSNDPPQRCRGGVAEKTADSGCTLVQRENTIPTVAAATDGNPIAGAGCYAVQSNKVLSGMFRPLA